MDISQVVERTAQHLKERQRYVRWAFQPSLDSVEILSPREQLEEFLSLTPEELAALRMRWGDDYFQRYLDTQLENYRKYGD